MTIYSLDVYIFLFGFPICSVSSSNCCFLTCIQISQEAGQVVWYAHLFKNFPQFIVIHSLLWSTVKGFGIVNKAEIDVFLELSCFFHDPRPGADCGSDHELLIDKFRLKLKKVGKTTRPFRYDLNQIPYDYTGEGNGTPLQYSCLENPTDRGAW